jgi:hypothetical protein
MVSLSSSLHFSLRLETAQFKFLRRGDLFDGGTGS